MRDLSEAMVLDALYKYGERAYIVLRSAYELYQVNALSNRKLPGDFDVKSLMSKLRERGVNYNPNQLLRILEREFGIIETTYRSSNQRWWRFTNPSAVAKALSIYEGGVDEDLIEDPEVLLLRLQTEVIDVRKLLNEVTELITKKTLTNSDRERVKELLFNDLTLVVRTFEKTQKYPDEFKEFNDAVTLLLKYLVVLTKRFKGLPVGDVFNEVKGEIANEVIDSIRR